MDNQNTPQLPPLEEADRVILQAKYFNFVAEFFKGLADVSRDMSATPDDTLNGEETMRVVLYECCNDEEVTTLWGIMNLTRLVLSGHPTIIRLTSRPPAA